jgi:phosphate transport system protein
LSRSDSAKDVDAKLGTLTAGLNRLGDLVVSNFANLSDGLPARDRTVMLAIAQQTSGLSNTGRDITALAIELIADASRSRAHLRQAFGSMQISREFEQIAMLLGSVARGLGDIVEQLPAVTARHVGELADLVGARIQQLNRGHANGDLGAIYRVWCDDGDIDRMHNDVFAETLGFIAESTRNISFGAPLLLCIKSLERVGDHATNAAEAAHYALTGRRLLEQRPKQPTTSIAADLPQFSGS